MSMPWKCSRRCCRTAGADEGGGWRVGERGKAGLGEVDFAVNRLMLSSFATHTRVEIAGAVVYR